METLLAYIPTDRRAALALGQSLPDRADGVALFADISGFTPLTETVTLMFGPRRGVEELTHQLNIVYDGLIGEIHRHNGVVISFSGDAVTCWFAEDDGLRATACAIALQRVMGELGSRPLPSPSPLALKVAIACGSVRRFLVGDPGIQLIETIAGATLERMAAAEHLAAPGEVVLDEATALHIEPKIEISSWRAAAGTRVAIIAGLREQAPESVADTFPLAFAHLQASDAILPELARPWLLPAVYERLQAGGGEFLTELRPVVSLFLQFAGIDYDQPEAGAMIDRFIRWLQSVMAAYDGTLVALTIGDKGSYVQVAFGAPLAHEDDAVRALNSALVLRMPPSDLAAVSEISIGLSAGVMRTGAYGGDERRTYGVLGSEVNLSARLMQHATPGQILVSRRLWLMAHQEYLWGELPALKLKGLRDPVQVYELHGRREQPGLHLHQPAATLPLVGRDAELALLDRQLQQTLTGHGAVVGVSAEAGMGKSRLIGEIVRLAQQRELIIYGAESESYALHSAYYTWRPIWLAFFGIDAARPDLAPVQQLEQALRRLDPDLLVRMPLLAPVLGLELSDNALTDSLDPEQRKKLREMLLLDCLKARGRALSRAGQALLIVLEDLHWADPLSHDLIELLARNLGDLPVCLIGSWRPLIWQERFPDQALTSLPHYRELYLGELSIESAEQLVLAKIATLHPAPQAPLPRAALERLMARAQGNPFYIEELLSYLCERGLDPYDTAVWETIELPASLHSLILSRIDQLSERHQRTLKVSSIIGRFFQRSWLAGYHPPLGSQSQVQHDLDQLSRIELVVPESASQNGAYLFKHAITQEVAYESLAYATRTQLHEQFASYVEREQDTIPVQVLDLLAYHYERSANTLKKCEYLRKAGEAAQTTYANEAALSYFQRLLPLVQEKPQQIEIVLKLGALFELLGKWEEAQQNYQQALALSDQHPSLEISLHFKAQACFALGLLSRKRGDYLEAERWLQQSHGSWAALEDTGWLGKVLGEQANLLRLQGDYAQAHRLFLGALELVRSANNLHAIAHTLNNLGLVAQYQGDFVAAKRSYEESLDRFRELDDKRGVGDVLLNLGNTAIYQGNYHLATIYLEECLLLDRQRGDKWSISFCLEGLGGAAFEQGDLVRARALFEESLSLARELGDRDAICSSLGNMGLVALSLVDYERARISFEESLQLAGQLANKSALAISHGNLGLVDFLQARYADALRNFAQGLMIAKEAGEKPLVLYNLVGIAASLLAADPNKVLPALRLHAAIERALDELEAVLPSEIRPLYDQIVDKARLQLTDDLTSHACAEGRQLGFNDLIAEALSLLA